MTAYYNEIDEYAADWLENLIAAGHIAPGVVDRRSSAEVQPDDVRDYDQCHFFAGIGGWSLALRLAGWPDDKPVWTGSCPCQPFSIAGQRKGFGDERHLWPAWAALIRERRPPVVFGEQSARAPEWLALVQCDLEEMGYAVGAMPIEAASVGSPQFRDRYFFVADANSRVVREQSGRCCGQDGAYPEIHSGSGGGTLARTDGRDGFWWSGPLQVGRNALQGKVERSGRVEDAQWPIKPGLSILAHGVPNRVGRLRAYGNAIVPQVAAAFIEAYEECRKK